MKTLKWNGVKLVDITVKVPDQFGEKINRSQHRDNLDPYTFIKMFEEYGGSLQRDSKKRETAFQNLLNIKPKKLPRNSTDVIRKEREKLDMRNK